MVESLPVVTTQTLELLTQYLSNSEL